MIALKESASKREREVKQSFAFYLIFHWWRGNHRKMSLDLKQLKELTASFKNASVRQNVSEDQVKLVFFEPFLNLFPSRCLDWLIVLLHV